MTEKQIQTKLKTAKAELALAKKHGNKAYMAMLEIEIKMYERQLFELKDKEE